LLKRTLAQGLIFRNNVKTVLKVTVLHIQIRLKVTTVAAATTTTITATAAADATATTTNTHIRKNPKLTDMFDLLKKVYLNEVTQICMTLQICYG
jgi:hypothetical protein